MKERTRRCVFAAVLALAVLGAVLLMGGSLIEDPAWRMWLQIVALGTALGCGTVCGILAWRWWGDQLVDERPLVDPTGPVPVRDDAADPPRERRIVHSRQGPAA